jgi:ATP-dependent exoDNAse (exonuclease V) beta subunit
VTGKNKEEYNAGRVIHLENAVKELMESGYQASDIAILVTRRESGKLAQKKLESMGIASYLGFGANLSESSAFHAVKALVQYIFRQEALPLARFLLITPAIVSSRKITNPSAFARHKALLDSQLAKSEGKPIYERIMAIGKRLSLANRFADEPNYLTLLNLIATHLATVRSPLAFIEQLEALSVSTTLSGSTSCDKVTIMTVHGAKGLQFPAVILFNVRESISSSAKQRYFMTIKGGEAQIHKQFKASLRPYTSEENKLAYEREQALIRYDKINQLYVAVTRAEHALYVIASTEKGTSDEFILAHFPEMTTLGELALSETAIPSPLGGRAQGGGDATLPFPQRGEYVPPKGEGDGTEELEALRAFEPQSARQHGIFIHEALYQMADFSEQSIKPAVRKAWNRYGAYLTAESLIAAENLLTLLCANAQWQSIVSGATIYRERAISHNGSLYFTDMYAVTESAVTVVDFKTGEPHGARHEEYIAQLSGYIEALKGQYDLPVNGYIVYLHGNEVMLF